jgi:hypothetical protein
MSTATKRHRQSPEQALRKVREGERLLSEGTVLTEVLRQLETSEVCVSKRSSGAGNQGPILIASATMWEMGVDSVGNGRAEDRSGPGRRGFVTSPPRLLPTTDRHTDRRTNEPTNKDQPLPTIPLR